MKQLCIIGVVVFAVSGCDSPKPPAKTPNVSHAGWIYETSSDTMRNTSTIWASLPSENYALFEGEVAPIMLQFYKTGTDEPSTRLLLKQALFDCSTYGGTHVCSLTAKVDDGPLQELLAREYDCGEYQCLSLSGDLLHDEKAPSAFQILHAGHDITIEVPLYHFGNQQYKFQNPGLAWN